MPEKTAPLLIAGAGPVGLLLANLLGQKNVHALVIEQKTSPVQTSNAIGITPPSLEILEKLNLSQRFISQGVQIQKAQIFGSHKPMGTLSFSQLKGKYPFILSLPQKLTEEILLANLEKFPSIEYRPGWRLDSLTVNNDNLDVSLVCMTDGQKQILNPEFVCACDGGKSTIRELLKLPYPGQRYPQTFLMGDFMDHTGWNSLVKLFFTRFGAVESFPLPEGKRRWVVQTPEFMDSVPLHYFEHTVYQRTGITLNEADCLWFSPFGTQHHLLENFVDFQQRIFFAGDAAHLLSPIGGQGMNTGFADAEFLAALLTKQFSTSFQKKAVSHYTSIRRKAAQAATRRAALSMWVGTRKGKVISAIRNFCLFLLLKSPLKRLLPATYAMQNVPLGNLTQLRKKKPSFFED